MQCAVYWTGLQVSGSGDSWVSMGQDRKIRLFKLLTGKQMFVIDESLAHYTQLQQVHCSYILFMRCDVYCCGLQVKQVMPAMEFGKKVSVEKEIAKAGCAKFGNILFDESGNFLVYSSLLGIKLVNTVTHKVSRLLGQREHLRPLALALFQGRPRSLAGTANTVESEASDNPGTVYTQYTRVLP